MASKSRGGKPKRKTASKRAAKSAATRRSSPSKSSPKSAKPVEQTTSWRELDSIQKFAILSNHYVTLQSLADALRIQPTQVKRIYATLQQGKRSKILEFDNLKTGIQLARRNMRDQVKRQRSRAQVATVAHVGPVTVTPFQPYVDLGRYGVQKSFWVGYHVEFLPESTIFELIEKYVDTFIDTGEFNSMRFEYIAHASIYLQESQPNPKLTRNILLPKGVATRFRDRTIRRQAEETGIVKLSSESIPFILAIEMGDGGEIYAQLIRDTWRRIQTLKGGIRITDLYFTNMPGMNIKGEARKDYNTWKQSFKRSGNGKGKARNKRGK